MVQTWSIAATLFIIIGYIQAYIFSTNFTADKILVWTPLILVINASSMLQVFFLVLEKMPVPVRDRVFLFDPTKDEGNGRVNLRRRLHRWGWRRGIDSSFHQPPQGPYAHRLDEQECQLVELPLDPRIDAGNNTDQNAPGENEAENANNEDAPQGAAAIHPDKHQGPAVTEQVAIWRDPALFPAIASALLFVGVIILQILVLCAAL
jgi:hypothetical protein